MNGREDGILMDGLFDGDDAAWARVADAAYVAVAADGKGEERAVSAKLRERLVREGGGAIGGGRAAAAPAARIGWPSWTGWAVAAAIAFAFLVFGLPAKAPGTAQAVAAVDASADKVSWAFAGLTDEFKGAKGTVVWSSKLQKGYLRLTNVPVNTPASAQYQLWIVDPARDTHPIDGGVFDVATGETLISIDAKLAVGTPAAFAITREKPGGVVVSAGPLLMAAKP
jgi:hypothetical protein